ncbi:hypothetical protein O3M35_002722 [Rhynocoris fuscipes]|uniref:Uncharacterized protein n=1 Tax=Rhynocoris fuscipes TaxID=488301 RepID=A0AAW1CSB2_9HEMI
MSAVYLIVEILLLSLSLTTNADENVKIVKGSYSKLETPNYPETFNINGSITWNFDSENADEKLKLHCDDFRLIQSEDCSLAKVEIDDGAEKKSYCGTQEMLKLISTSNKLTVTLVGQDDYGQGVFSCIVKTLEPEPEVVELSINKLYHFEGPSEPTPYFDKLWHFKTAEGQKVELKCYINLLEEDEGMPCFEEVLTVDLGDGPQEFCGYEDKIFFSKGNEAKLRLELGANGVGEFHCAAQAVVKEDPVAVDQMENVARTLDDEDSSEHGGPAGKKSTTCKCGWANKPRGRIINGREASPNEYPWIVALKAYFGEAFINCGGSIITQRHILTAAHCLLNMYVDMSEVKPQDVIVYVGAHNLEKLSPTVKQYKAEKIFIRPEFIKQYTHDFAMVVVDNDIEFSQSVGPICLSPKRIAEINQKITILGWGKTQTGNPSPVLMKAKTAVIDRKKCDINPWEICTRAKPSATCTGDSGGPLSWLDPETNRYTLMSLVSYGDPDCVSSPSVSTDIAFFYDWIQEKIKETHPHLATCTKQ